MNILQKLRAAILANKTKRFCFVGPDDRKELESHLKVLRKTPLSFLEKWPAPEESFMNFDGVYLIEDANLQPGKFVFHGKEALV